MSFQEKEPDEIAQDSGKFADPLTKGVSVNPCGKCKRPDALHSGYRADPMEAVHIDNVKVGMVLSDDVRDISSRLLLSKGNPIAPQHIRVFKIWGITEVIVEGTHDGGAPDTEPVDPEERETIRVAMEKRFIHNDPEHPAVRELFSDFRLHFLRRRCRKANRPNRPVSAGHSPPPVQCNLRKELEGTVIKLPEMPSIISELNGVISTPFASASDIARIVEQKPESDGPAA